MRFQIESTCPQSAARTGVLHTAHAAIETPVFMPVGTLGTVKGIDQTWLEEEADAAIILGNTYHLYLRPGLDIIQAAGGLHGFNDWSRGLLTDSGGYQVYSLAHKRKIKEEGVTFASHIDGSAHTFTPENVIDTQRIIGADIIMAFDECTPYPCDRKYALDSMKMTHRWLDRCRDRFAQSPALYGYDQILAPIVQGSVYPDLRKISAETIASAEAEVNAIGGLSVGEEHALMYDMTAVCTDILPRDRPRYLMGVGTPSNIVECVARGIDMFDCVLPTRNARHGLIYTSEGVVNIRNRKWADCMDPIDPEGCASSRRYSKAYLRHLIACKEVLGATLASRQNIHFYLNMMRNIRKHIASGSFDSFRKEILDISSRRL
ncbi:MAG: tRNA guanosine(34) transglycosylase Tgt [Saprospiraceae bacterium]|nr:tRNA guanosine(34) transglycosylase Tgt [Saprospiraceae bacterium]